MVERSEITSEEAALEQLPDARLRRFSHLTLGIASEFFASEKLILCKAAGALLAQRYGIGEGTVPTPTLRWIFPQEEPRFDRELTFEGDFEWVNKMARSAILAERKAREVVAEYERNVPQVTAST